MRSRALTLALVIAGLMVIGVGLNPWIEPVAQAQRGDRGENRKNQRPLTVQSASIGLLGGFRSLAADLVWLRAYVAWEKRDAGATNSLVKLTTTLDDRPLSFWLNGARIMAYDIPAWQVDEARARRNVSPEEQTQIARAQAWQAISHLEQAMLAHPTSAALWIERANIELNRLGDRESAAESYRKASEQPGAPFFPARVYAELLRGVGRKAEALVWLVKLHPGLPKNVEAAAAGLVLSRIRALELELGVPPEARFAVE